MSDPRRRSVGRSWRPHGRSRCRIWSADDPALVFVGINPGLWTAASGAHFAHPGNRFYPALARSGILDRTQSIHGAGSRTSTVRLLTGRGLAITNLVMRTTARADELDPQEFVDGVARLERKVRRWAPRVVAFVGLGAYRTGYGQAAGAGGAAGPQ